MTFGLKSPRKYISDKHADLQQSVRNALGGDDTTVATIVSMHDGRQGQWILADTKYDKKKLARRLRLCADIIDPPANWQWWATVKDDGQFEYGPHMSKIDAINAVLRDTEKSCYEATVIEAVPCIVEDHEGSRSLFAMTRNREVVSLDDRR